MVKYENEARKMDSLISQKQANKWIGLSGNFTEILIVGAPYVAAPVLQPGLPPFNPALVTGDDMIVVQQNIFPKIGKII